MTKLHRRRLLAMMLGVSAIASFTVVGTPGPARAAEDTVTIGITLSLTGADADAATRILHGAQMAIEEANAQGGVAGYKLEAMVLDDATATAGQYDPAQAALSAKKLIANANVVANVGPMMSGSGKAMSPILSAGDLATITPSSTNPDITDPKFAGQYRPKGKAVYFRTLTTDAYQGPNMANYMKDTLHVKSVYVLDDSGAYGVGMANAFEAQAKKIGLDVMGHDQLNPKEADYTTVVTKIKGLNPDAVYYGGVAQAGIKLAKQAHDVIPKVIKAGGDGMQGGDVLKGVGFPAIEGWYATSASPDLVSDPKVQDWVKRYQEKYKTAPSNYAITAYDGALVIIDAIKRVAASGQEVNRSNVRDAIQQTKLDTLQGEVTFDDNGDINQKVVSVYRITHNPKYAEDDVVHQFKYVGVAPEEPTS
jgi:branched-chain amino acid transport system substrate-binding protein